MTHCPKIILALALLAFAPLAHAQKRDGYFRLGIGFSGTTEKKIIKTTPAAPATPADVKEERFYSGLVIEVAAGGYMGDHFALEMMASVSRGVLDTFKQGGATVVAKGERLNITGMGNFYLLGGQRNIQPYLVAGVGVGYKNGAEARAYGIWNAGGGINFFLRHDLAIGIGYRFLAGLDFKQVREHHATANLTHTF